MRTQAEYLDMVARVNRLTRKSKILLGDRLNEKREEWRQVSANTRFIRDYDEAVEAIKAAQRMGYQWHQVWCVAAQATLASFDVDDTVWNEALQILASVEEEQKERAEDARRHHRKD